MSVPYLCRDILHARVVEQVVRVLFIVPLHVACVVRQRGHRCKRLSIMSEVEFLSGKILQLFFELTKRVFSHLRLVHHAPLGLRRQGGQRVLRPSDDARRRRGEVPRKTVQLPLEVSTVNT